MIPSLESSLLHRVPRRVPCPAPSRMEAGRRSTPTMDVLTWRRCAWPWHPGPGGITPNTYRHLRYSPGQEIMPQANGRCHRGGANRRLGHCPFLRSVFPPLSPDNSWRRPATSKQSLLYRAHKNARRPQRLSRAAGPYKRCHPSVRRQSVPFPAMGARSLNLGRLRWRARQAAPPARRRYLAGSFPAGRQGSSTAPVPRLAESC